MILFVLLILIINLQIGKSQQFVPINERIDCHPSPNANPENCKCKTWISTADKYPSELNIPLCYFPPNSGYQNATEDGKQYTLSNPTLNPALSNSVKNISFYGEIFQDLSFNYTEMGNAINIRIKPKDKERFEPDKFIKIPRTNVSSSESLKVNFTIPTQNKTGIFSFKVFRSSNNVSLWDTSIGGLLFADQYIQIAAYLPTKRIYGFGEQTHNTLMHNLTKYVTWGMYARDMAPDASDPWRNLYGVHPFYLGLEDDGKAHGVLIWNSNAQEVTLGPAPHLIYRTIGGMLDITFFPGPKPEDVIQQYINYIGKPYLPSYSSLGFQLSRWGFTSLNDMENTVERVKAENIPLDIVYADVDYMDRYIDFTVGNKWEALGNYTKQLHKDGMYLYLIFDPGIQVNSSSFYEGLDEKAYFISWPNMSYVPKEQETNYSRVYNTTIMLGVVWPDWNVAFPDFLVNTTEKWWIKQFKQFHENVSLDGIWIDMNEPSNFGTNEEKPDYWNEKQRPAKLSPLMCELNNTYDNPPYKTVNVYNYNKYWHNKDELCTKTLCMIAKTNDGNDIFYNTKNLYGISEMIATQEALRSVMKKRGTVLSRSTFVSSGHYGSHWLGDSMSHWMDMRASMIGVMEFNMFGIPHVGSDICGFNDDTTEELCLRWHQLGAFYPFCRNHNSMYAKAQDPSQWSSVARAARQAITFRYHYIPYLYSLIFAASSNGSTVARPVFFEFPNDQNTQNLGHQFLWGSAMMIIPAVYEGEEMVIGYLPPDATWYSIRQSDYGYKMHSGFNTFSAPFTDMIPVFVRGGYILPRQKPESTTTASRKNPFEMLIAMEYQSDGKALPSKGFFIWDDGESLELDYYHWEMEFTVTNERARLVIKTIKKATPNVTVPSLDIIDIVGYNYKPDMTTATLNNKSITWTDWSKIYDATTGRFSFSKEKLMKLTIETNVLEWKHSSVIGNETVAITKRVDCHPSPNVNQSECTKKYCVWDQVTIYQQNPTVPLCYMPPNSGYIISDESISNGQQRFLLDPAPYGAYNFYGTNVKLNFESVEDGSGASITIAEFGTYRYLPPVSMPRGIPDDGETLQVKVLNRSPFAFAVVRPSTGRMLWDTTIGGLMFADKFIQIATYLPSENVYGFGENYHTTLKHNFNNYQTWPMFSRDQPPDPNKPFLNLYGVHPFYLCLEPDGNAHGVLILNSNAQEVTTGPAPHLIYRTIGGMLEIKFFGGPTPEAVTQQYHQFIGLPFLPAYFGFGYQLSRYGYQNLTVMENEINENRDLGVPLDVVYADIDYMDRFKDFTTKWKGFPEYAEKLHTDGMHLVLIFDPAIEVTYNVFQRGLDMNASFIEWPELTFVPSYQSNYSKVNNTKIMLGVVWPYDYCAFPDFSDDTGLTEKWWIDEFVKFHKELAFDGIWIDMNEPANFGTDEKNPWYYPEKKIPPLMCPTDRQKSTYDTPPYETWSVYNYENEANPPYLASKTVCMFGVTNRGKSVVYDTKNLYGLFETIATQKALYKATGKRGFVLSRSTFPSSGHYSGHWTGDNSAGLKDLQVSTIGIQEFNMFGIPYVGADICGFGGHSTENLCLRWQQLGAFYSFMRNHNAINSERQDPAHWPETVGNATIQANLFRYHYLPYLYSLHFDVSLHGGTVVRPLFFEFPNDNKTYELSHQFMWGSGMLIVPVIEENVSYVVGYVPNALWYSLRDSDYGHIIEPGMKNFSAPTTDLIPVMVRGGSILPRQKPETTTTKSRTNPFELLIALDNNIFGIPAKATGQLYWDDGEKIIENINNYNYYHWMFSFRVTNETATLVIDPVKVDPKLKVPNLQTINIFGYGNYCASTDLAMMNGNPIKLQSSKQPNYFNITINIEIANDDMIMITWPHAVTCPTFTTKASQSTTTMLTTSSQNTTTILPITAAPSRSTTASLNSVPTKASTKIPLKTTTKKDSSNLTYNIVLLALTTLFINYLK